MNHFLLLASFSLLFTACQQSSKSSINSKKEMVQEIRSSISTAQQLIVVTAKNDSIITGQLRKYESSDNSWNPVGTAHPITLGKKGLAWGYGEHPTQKGYHKQEGDGKSPAGIFSFAEAFGYAPKTDSLVQQFRLPYVQLSKVTQCIEDSNSQYYNQIIEGDEVEKDWTSSDFMRRDDHLYKWGFFVNHNVPAQAKRGSCIFFHLWRASNKPTLGCTGMQEKDILDLLKWLDPEKSPILVQLTEAHYAVWQKKYGLPKL